MGLRQSLYRQRSNGLWKQTVFGSKLIGEQYPYKDRAEPSTSQGFQAHQGFCTTRQLALCDTRLLQRSVMLWKGP